MRRNECDRCGLAACDLPDGVDPDLIFERVGTAMLCRGCQSMKQDPATYDCAAFDCGCSPEAMRSCPGRTDQEADDGLTVVPMVPVEETAGEAAWSEERCELSDLPVGQCACRVHGPQQEARPAETAFRARFPGQCMECMEVIEAGDMIAASTLSGDGGYVHEECW